MKNAAIGLLVLFASVPAFADLGQLDSATFPCTAAALNAAAKAASAVQSKGSYHFTSFKEISGSSQYSAEVGFVSNDERDPALNYSVALYCQQGWDPNSTVQVTRK